MVTVLTNLSVHYGTTAITLTSINFSVRSIPGAQISLKNSVGAHHIFTGAMGYVGKVDKIQNIWRWSINIETAPPCYGQGLWIALEMVPRWHTLYNLAFTIGVEWSAEFDDG